MKEYEGDEKRVNKKKVAEKLRRTGEEYVSVKTKKTVKARQLGLICKHMEWCKRGGRECAKLTE